MEQEELTYRLQQIPRLSLCNLPTPLEKWQRLAAAWCPGSQLLVKRDDLTGLALGGNKSRQLEFVLADASKDDADVVIHGGAVQSGLLSAARGSDRRSRLGVPARSEHSLRSACQPR